jgi:hypothetical protein
VAGNLKKKFDPKVVQDYIDKLYEYNTRGVENIHLKDVLDYNKNDIYDATPISEDMLHDEVADVCIMLFKTISPKIESVTYKKGIHKIIGADMDDNKEVLFSIPINFQEFNTNSEIEFVNKKRDKKMQLLIARISLSFKRYNVEFTKTEYKKGTKNMVKFQANRPGDSSQFWASLNTVNKQFGKK